jgi:hypothetical protein
MLNWAARQGRAALKRREKAATLASKMGKSSAVHRIRGRGTQPDGWGRTPIRECGILGTETIV